ncbi:MAG: HlyD family efflux transporter periplasmic adaptor subunit, partial [Oscillospiraceae bacterium]
AETRAKADEYTAEASDEYITASQAGYFCSRTDGFEGTATSEKAMTVTADELSAMMNSGTYESGGCKLITSYTWYFAALVPADVIDRFTVGDDISITFGDDSDKTLPVEVVRAEAEDGAENGVVVFSCNDINSEIAEARFENCRINFYDYKGIMVQRSALHVVDGETGVYVKYGTQVIFKKIDPVYSTKDYVISRLNTSDDGYLRLYDEIITEGKDLYDGRDLSR